MSGCDDLEPLLGTLENCFWTGLHLRKAILRQGRPEVDRALHDIDISTELADACIHLVEHPYSLMLVNGMLEPESVPDDLMAIIDVIMAEMLVRSSAAGHA